MEMKNEWIRDETGRENGSGLSNHSSSSAFILFHLAPDLGEVAHLRYASIVVGFLPVGTLHTLK